MSKYDGEIGFAVSSQTSPGVWEDSIVERPYFGEITRNYKSIEGNEIVDDLNVSISVSVIADPFAYENFHHMKYLRYMGTEWKITSIEPAYPRLQLSIGGIYNGETKASGTP